MEININSLLQPSKLYLLEPIVVKKPWGVSARTFAQYTHVLPRDHRDTFGELWTASAQIGEINQANRVASYCDRNKPSSLTLHDIILRERHHLLGKNLAHHLQGGKPRGKTESWYIRDVSGIVKIITGIKKEITRQRFTDMVRSGYFHNRRTIDELERDLVTTELARRGETYIVRPGTLHTLWPMDRESYAIIDEVQQGFGASVLPTLSKVLLINDVLSLKVHPHDMQVQQERRPDVMKLFFNEPSIRVSDFGRGRPIHPELTADLVQFNRTTCTRTTPLLEHIGERSAITHLLANNYFAKDRLQMGQGGTVTLSTNGKQYYILNVLKGTIAISTHSNLYELSAGQTALIPAYFGVYTIEACEESDMLLDYVPDIRETILHLEDKGFSPEEICGLDGACFENDIKKDYGIRQVVV